VRKIAQGAALMTETTLEEHFLSGAYNMLSNSVISERMMQVLEDLGPIEFTDEEIAFGKTIEESFPESLRKSILKSDHLPLSLLGQGLSGDVWPIRDAGEVMPGSTDVSDVSWITPTSQLTTACFALAVPGHSWGITATSGMSIGQKGMLHAAKGMAITAADFILDPELRQLARDEFVASTAGQPYQCPIPPEVQPRIA
jgi:aminobenzoyl-glutamate utilization protein B